MDKLRTSNRKLQTKVACGIFLATDASTMPTAPEPYESSSFRFACDIVHLYRRLIKLPEMPHTIARQLLRSGTSIGANLAEAKVAQSRRDTRSRFSIALKEAKETQYWLRLIAATRPASDALVGRALREATELVAILTTSRRKLGEPAGTDEPENVGRG